MTVYWSGNDPYCWPNTTTLRNRLNITASIKLQSVESDLVRARADLGLPAGRFSLTHYRSCHKWLFGDVYAWAGNYRSVRLTKVESVFCFPEFIDCQMRALFLGLKQTNFLCQKDPVEFVQRAAHFWSEINAIHPFREGNGRTQTLFLAQMALDGGWFLDLTRLLPEPTIAAMTASFKTGNGKPLEPLIEGLIRP